MSDAPPPPPPPERRTPPPPPGATPPPAAPVPPGQWTAPPPPMVTGMQDLASWGIRLGAYLIDGVILTGILLVTALALGLVIPTEIEACTVDGEFGLCEVPTSTGWAMVIIGIVAYLALVVWYLGWRQGVTGQTVGKRAVGIRVVREHSGELMGGGRGIGRMFATYISSMVCYLGYLWPLWDGRNQTFHDKIVDTVVIRV